ncbi:14173_t:CDS:2 [Racocetra fulgida]|uniref:14173_t:CDS:1 n=1 Tax=Racocetra fulgida TaxID=60492 RepID=A0A9N8ZXQ5_9GLOM|nr:14173_t:CDS:2 [Racocetra fulgida]
MQDLDESMDQSLELEMQRYIVASRINVAPGAGVAILTAVQAIGAGNGGNQIGGLNIAEKFRNKARAEIGRIGANLGQLLYLFSTSYMTVEHLKQMAVFGQLMQGDMGVEEFSTQIKKDIRENITRALAKVEKFTLSQRNAPSSLPVFLAANSYIDTNKLEITKTEIIDLIKTAIAFSESQTA